MAPNFAPLFSHPQLISPINLFDPPNRPQNLEVMCPHFSDVGGGGKMAPNFAPLFTPLPLNLPINIFDPPGSPYPVN